MDKTKLEISSKNKTFYPYSIDNNCGKYYRIKVQNSHDDLDGFNYT